MWNERNGECEILSCHLIYSDCAVPLTSYDDISLSTFPKFMNTKLELPFLHNITGLAPMIERIIFPWSLTENL